MRRCRSASFGGSVGSVSQALETHIRCRSTLFGGLFRRSVGLARRTAVSFHYTRWISGACQNVPRAYSFSFHLVWWITRSTIPSRSVRLLLSLHFIWWIGLIPRWQRRPTPSCRSTLLGGSVRPLLIKPRATSCCRSTSFGGSVGRCCHGR